MSFTFISSHLISFPLIHLLSFPFVSSPISCHVPLGDDMDQCLNVDQWQKKSEKESKTEKDEEESKEKPSKFAYERSW